MKLGDKKSFAVEFDLDESYGGAWLFGKFCYWIDGVQVGDYELGTSLRDVLFGMKRIVGDCGDRDGEILCELPPQEVFSVLDGSLYESDEGETHSEIHLPHTPARFEIKINVDVFDEWKVYLIDCGDQAKIFFKSTDAADIKAVTLAPGLFDNVIKETYDCLSKLYERESIGIS